MTLSRRHPLGVLVVIVASIAVAASFGVFAPRVQAFYIANHETITRNALPADQVSQAAMNQILIGPPPGGNKPDTHRPPPRSRRRWKRRIRDRRVPTPRQLDHSSRHLRPRKAGLG